MIIEIFDYNMKNVNPIIGIVEYYKGKKIHFDEKRFPLSDISLEHIYVGF